MTRHRGFENEDIQWVAPNDVGRDPAVNRLYEEYRSRAMVDKGFDPKRARTAGYVISERPDGSRIWIDGQHRGEAAGLDGCGDVPVPMIVLTGLTKTEETEWVLLYQEDRKRTTPADAHRLGVGSGRLPDLILDAACAAHGIRASGRGGEGRLASVATARRIAGSENGAEILDLSLGTLMAAFGRDSAALEGPLIDGMARFWGANNGNVDRPALIKKLAKREGGAPGIISAARSLRSMTGTALGRNAANVIVGTYNKGRQSDRLPTL